MANPENLYHVLLTTCHMPKNPNNVVEKIRITGTYTSLLAAKAAAHSCLYDAGYEREWFTEYETNPEVWEDSNLPERTGLAIYAVAPDGTAFRVRINTTSNDDSHFTSDSDDGRVSIPIFYVLQANVEYNSDEGSSVRDINVQGTFKTYEEARNLAGVVLLSEENGITKESFAEYDEAANDANDCGYGENVIVHAVSEYGTNYLISVIKTQELESERLAEAAMQIL